MKQLFSKSGFTHLELVAFAALSVPLLMGFMQLKAVGARMLGNAQVQRTYYQIRSEAASEVANQIHQWVRQMAIPPPGAVRIPCSSDLQVGTPFDANLSVMLPSQVQAQLLNAQTFAAFEADFNHVSSHPEVAKAIARCKSLPQQSPHMPAIYPSPDANQVAALDLGQANSYYFCFVLKAPAPLSNPSLQIVAESKPILIEAIYQIQNYDTTAASPQLSAPLSCSQVTQVSSSNALVGRFTYGFYWSGMVANQMRTEFRADSILVR